jgi:hypothetical protein
MKKLILFLAVFTFCVTGTLAQTDLTSESQLNVSSGRNVSGGENNTTLLYEAPKVPQDLLNRYTEAVDSRNEEQKIIFGKQVDSYLNKPDVNNQQPDVQIIKDNLPPLSNDWYGSDVLVTNGDVTFQGSYRQMELKQGEDGWMYLAVNRRNVPGYLGYITVYRSSNGGANWTGITNIVSASAYLGSVTMLVESRSSSIADSTRIILYATFSANENMNDASLIFASFRRSGAASYVTSVAVPPAGNHYEFPSACSDGMFFSSATYMHVVAREETNAGEYVRLVHFRSTDWGVSHTSSNLNTFNDDLFPACAFSNENGTDSVYIAVERVISVTEHEIRLIATPETPASSISVRYITDAVPGIIYKRPAITIQQRHFSLPQQILVTSTKNDRAVYHYSNDGGAFWNVDATLGTNTQAVDYTSCNSDSLTAGGNYFIAAMVDLDGDSIMVRRGVLGSMGTPQYRKNTNVSTGVLAPTCAIYKEGANKYSAFAYAGFGPANVYYNMESLITGIESINSEIPSGFRLSQNYPNPFNPVTNIEFALPNKSFVKLVVYDMLGKMVETLVNGEYGAGTYKVDWNAANLPSGVYFYKLETGSFTSVKKMMLVK